MNHDQSNETWDCCCCCCFLLRYNNFLVKTNKLITNTYVGPIGINSSNYTENTRNEDIQILNNVDLHYQVGDASILLFEKKIHTCVSQDFPYPALHVCTYVGICFPHLSRQLLK